MRVELKSVLQRYGKNVVLQYVNSAFEGGKVHVLVGRNGAGKSTVLRVLTGLQMPTEGRVEFDGRVFERDDVEMRRRFVLVPDFPILYWDQSVIQNISTYLYLWGVKGEDAEDRVTDLLEKFELLDKIHRPVAMLSRGQQYKVGISAMAAVNADFWLLDEPFASGMDPEGLTIFKELVRDAVAMGKTVVYTTQILELAESFSDVQWVVHRGRLTAVEEHASGTLEELFLEITQSD